MEANNNEWTIERKGRNSHVIKSTFDKTQDLQKVGLLSDIHWDNPHCNRELLKKHLDYFLQNNIPIILNGDTFCAMQGKYDKRSSKVDILPEHMKGNYLDLLVSTAAEYFAPYSKILTVVGYGNHETAIQKRHETDLIERFVQALKSIDPQTTAQAGGYGGFIRIQCGRKSGRIDSQILHYFHGAGGGGPVTRGVIQTNRQSVYLDGVDIVHGGHTHDAWTLPIQKIHLDSAGNIRQSRILFVRTPGYKDEYVDGHSGFHIETGRPPKPLGCSEISIGQYYEKQGDRRCLFTDSRELWH